MCEGLVMKMIPAPFARGLWRPPRREAVPRPWQRHMFFTWMRMLSRNHFAVNPRSVPRAVGMTALVLLLTAIGLLEDAWYAGDPRRTTVPRSPLFVLGHWRTGTTLLHELLGLDERHAFPTTYQCLLPSGFLFTQGFLPRLLKWLVPAHRPQDEMAIGFDTPQEEEFALHWQGAVSPYREFYFPDQPDISETWLGMDKMDPHELECWKSVFLRFLSAVAFSNPGKRLVLKSPTHSCRVKVLLELFPDAQFVHIVRSPFAVYPSALRTFRLMAENFGFQKSAHRNLHNRVFQVMLRVYELLEEARGLINPGRFCELRYEDLVTDPPSQIQALYQHLNLGGFDQVEPLIRKYFADRKSYQTGCNEISPELQVEIQRCFAPILQRYGYGEYSGETERGKT